MTDDRTTTARTTKTAAVRALLAAEGGTSLAAIRAATGWQAHSVRAMLSTLRKSGCTIAREVAPGVGEAVYRLVEVPRPVEVPKPEGADGDRSRSEDHGAEPSAEPIPAKRRARRKVAGSLDDADPAVHPMPAHPEPLSKAARPKVRR